MEWITRRRNIVTHFCRCLECIDGLLNQLKKGCKAKKGRRAIVKFMKRDEHDFMTIYR
jgi:hypothetical protein